MWLHRKANIALGHTIYPHPPTPPRSYDNRLVWPNNHLCISWRKLVFSFCLDETQFNLCWGLSGFWKNSLEFFFSFSFYFHLFSYFLLLPLYFFLHFFPFFTFFFFFLVFFYLCFFVLMQQQVFTTTFFSFFICSMKKLISVFSMFGRC